MFFIKKRAIFLAFTILLSFIFYYKNSTEEILILPTLISIPLDDRPINTYDAKKIANIGGLDLRMPDEKYLGNFDNLGDFGKITEWLNEESKGNIEGFIISADMLAYGGLVASRTNHISYNEALDNLKIIKTLKKNNPDKPIYVFDTIQRLAPTVISQEDKEHYQIIRQWSIYQDKVNELQNKEDIEKLNIIEGKLSPKLKKQYLENRERNHKINLKLIEWLEEGYIDFLIFAQDDSSEFGIHRQETVELKEKSKKIEEDKIVFLSGADELDLILISRFAQKKYNENIKYYAHYPSEESKQWYDPFDSLTVEENIKKHIIAMNSSLTNNPEEADIHLIINTPTNNNNYSTNNSIILAKNLLKKGKSLAIVDLINLHDKERFLPRVKNKIDLSKIYSFSSWNTSGNAIGITLAHSSLRKLSLKKTEEKISKFTTRTHIEFLLKRFTKDEGYKKEKQEIIRNYINDKNYDSFNFKDNYAEVLAYSKPIIEKETIEWFEYLKNRKIPYSKGKYLKLSEIEEIKIDFPWKRLFEIDLEIKLK